MAATCSIRTDGKSSRVSIESDGRPVAAADIVDGGTAVLLRFRVDGGHLPMHVRHQLMQAVF
ncbi:MAG TPA: hypothetical protein VEK09_02655, partial [Jatrophihabitantaceae bacterium]|nr:hypothetical protein [Jatrophihabitantaceae bacterium]